MSDLDKIRIEVACAEQEGREISDACARMIASLWHGGPGTLGHAFASTGAIPENPSLVWEDLYGPWDADRKQFQGAVKAKANPEDRRAMNYLGTYLVNAGARGPVAGWSSKSM